MTFRIDRAGRVVLPKPVRERWGLRPGTELELVERPEGLLLKPVAVAPALVKEDGLWLHKGAADPNARWDLIEQGREERLHSILGLPLGLPE